jgi:hypothetical protein
MDLTDLRGPFPLLPAAINNAVTRARPGVYALGKVGPDQQAFEVRYVGRDDQDVMARIKTHVAEWYPHFLYQHLAPQLAFERECELYHDFNPPDNPTHPVRAPNTDWVCPRCGLAG